MVACTGNVQDCVGNSCLTGCQQQRAYAAFQGSDTVFDYFLGGVGEASVMGPSSARAKRFAACSALSKTKEVVW